MIHLWMTDKAGKPIEADSFCLSNPGHEYDTALAAAQQWANDYGDLVEMWDYEGHETIEDGEFLEFVRPQPLQLGLIPGASAVVAGEDTAVSRR
jgi:hypothetical protein